MPKKNEYEKLSQKDIEDDMNQLVDNQIESLCGSYMKMQKKQQ